MKFISSESDKQDQLYDILYTTKETLEQQVTDVNNGIINDNSPLFQSIKDGVLPSIYVAVEFPNFTIYKISYK